MDNEIVVTQLILRDTPHNRHYANGTSMFEAALDDPANELSVDILLEDDRYEWGAVYEITVRKIAGGQSHE